MAYKKYVKKAKRWVNKKIAKPYVTGKPKRTHKARMNLYGELAAIKRVINAEKKRYDISYTNNLALGQVLGNNAGNAIIDITPVPSTGSLHNQRNGASIKLSGSHFTFAFQQQVSTVTPIKVRIWIVHITGQPQTPATWLANTFEYTNFVLNAGTPSIIDMNSEKDIDFARGYKVLVSKTAYLRADNYSGVLGICNFKFGVKYSSDFHVKFNNDGSTVTNGQLLMFLQPDIGNGSAVTACTLTGVPITAVSTGCNVNYNIKHFYYDN